MTTYKTTVELNDSEHASILAGLRVLQLYKEAIIEDADELRWQRIIDISTACGEVEPMSSMQIDELCEKLNCELINGVTVENQPRLDAQISESQLHQVFDYLHADKLDHMKIGSDWGIDLGKLATALESAGIGVLRKYGDGHPEFVAQDRL